MTIDRDRAADLDTLADAVLSRLEDGGDRYWGLDGARPLGSSSGRVGLDVLAILGADVRDAPYGFAADFGPWVEYAEGLWGDLIGHINARWKASRAAGR